MTTGTSIPKNHSNVIYLQDSLHFPEIPYPNHILQLPFAEIALHFPWKTLFSSHEQHYLQARLEQHRRNPEVIQEDVLFDLPSSPAGKARDSFLC